MLGLSIYSYIDGGDVQFYKMQKTLAKKMDILDWIQGSFVDKIVQGGGNPLGRARRMNPQEFSMRDIVIVSEPLVVLHSGNPSRIAGSDVEEVEVKQEEEEKEGGTSSTK